MKWGGELPPRLVIGVEYADEAEAYNENYRLLISHQPIQAMSIMMETSAQKRSAVARPSENFY